ncbi:MAG: DUF1064 domain-containing protein [Chloracidobacterium sp.]|nr:DUF1064 domain-containing protein [Chloracidobacterium sp.]
MAFLYSNTSRSRNKFNAVKTEVDGFVFDSEAEARRYSELLILEKAGEIKSLCLQPVFTLIVNGERVGKYIADFKYLTAKGETVVEDVKGVKTPVYRLKKKLVKAIYGFDIVEV